MKRSTNMCKLPEIFSKPDSRLLTPDSRKKDHPMTSSPMPTCASGRFASFVSCRMKAMHWACRSVKVWWERRWADFNSRECLSLHPKTIAHHCRSSLQWWNPVRAFGRGAAILSEIDDTIKVKWIAIDTSVQNRQDYFFQVDKNHGPRTRCKKRLASTFN